MGFACKELRPSNKGDAAEAAVVTDIFFRGYSPSVPIASDVRYDLVVDRNDGTGFHRLQVKFVASDDGCIPVPTHWMCNGAAIPYTKDDVDYIAAYDVTQDKVYYIPIEEVAGRTWVVLRLKPYPVHKKRMPKHWAFDYEDF